MKAVLRGLGLAVILFAASNSDVQGAGCRGTCTINCPIESDTPYAIEYYNVTAAQCCGQLNQCGGNAVWWPTTCGIALVC
jgi:hypothetical protein